MKRETLESAADGKTVLRSNALLAEVHLYPLLYLRPTYIGTDRLYIEGAIVLRGLYRVPANSLEI